MTMLSRDRVMIDLCGIGEAVRSAATARGTSVAVFARQALIAALTHEAATLLRNAEPSAALTGTIKLSVRLSAADSAALATHAAALGLSQARLVALLIRRAELPVPAAERRAELAALQTSNDQLAAIVADLSLFVRTLSRPDMAVLAPLRQRMLNLDTDIARHLQIAAALLARTD